MVDVDEGNNEGVCDDMLDMEKIVTINAAVHYLSLESQKNIHELGQSCICAYAYDNFDVQLKTTRLMIKHLNENLYHLTSGLLFPLEHVTLKDLKCSNYLWELSEYNPDVLNPAIKQYT
jgi:hypothetical protein